MADEIVNAPADPSPVEAEAKTMGWAPKENFRGDPEKWVDAETFVERGRVVMPLLKQNNVRLQGQLGEVKDQLGQVTAALRESQETIKNLTTFQADQVKRQVESRLAELRGQKKAARKAEDFDLVDDIDEQIATTQAELANPPKPAPVRAPAPGPATPKVEPWAQAFADENEWLGKDKRKTALFAAEAEELATAGELKGKALLEEAKERMEKILSPKPAPTSKVEGQRGGGNDGGGRTRERGFSDLPSDAKAQCKADERKFVGKGKAFTDSASWQKHYAEVYFADE